MTTQLTLDGSATRPSSETAADSIRDRERERRILSEAAGGFADHAVARLDAGQPIYGDSWAWIGTRRHLVDLLELAADLGGRVALAEQALDRERGVDDETRYLRQALRHVAALAAEAHLSLNQSFSVVRGES